MNDENVKKWFVYLEDHHEGPFTPGEIQFKINSGVVSQATYVWCEGMSDWKIITDANIPSLQFSPSLNHADQPSKNPIEKEPSLIFENSLIPPSQDQAQDLSISAQNNENSNVEIGLQAPPSPLNNETETSYPFSNHSSPSTENANSETEPTPETQMNNESADSPHSQRPTEYTQTSIKKFETRTILKATKYALIIAIIASPFVAYFTGLLKPIVEHPITQATREAVTELSEPYLLQLVEKFPALSSWISPIAELADVSPENYEKLKQAAIGNPKTVGPKMDAALSTSNLSKPVFYIATNLPDGANFEIYLEGTPETLLNATQFSTQTTAVTIKRLARSTSIEMADKSAIPQGEYRVFVMESENQPDATKNLLEPLPPSNTKIPETLSYLPRGRKLINTQILFLGGKNDSAYQNRLKEYHDRLREKAQQELNETKQYAATLKMQFENTRTEFQKVSKIPLKTKNKRQTSRITSWNAFSTDWNKIQSPLQETINKWNDEVIRQDYFYPSLYLQIKSVHQLITSLHQSQTLYFTGKDQNQSFDIQHGAEISNVQNNIEKLFATIDQAQALGTTPNGMPVKLKDTK